MLTAWLGDRVFGWADLGAAALPGAEPSWMPWATYAAYFTPGAVLGGIVGWFIIGPVNDAMALFFKAFNRGVRSRGGDLRSRGRRRCCE